MNKFIYLLLSFVIAGCVTKSEIVKIQYDYFDNPKEKRLDLVYRNTSTHAMCIHPDHWPNVAGKIDQAGDYVYLIVNQQRFPIKNFNTGYCPGCATRVEPGKEIRAFISYEDFNLPEAFHEKVKVLDFHPNGHACTHGNK